MRKLIKCLLLVICLMTVVGCQPSEADKAKTYSEEVTKLVTDKGYTVEEIASLQNKQRVDKVYDNEVLEYFGKILVNEYSVTVSTNDGWFEGAHNYTETAYSVETLENFQASLSNYYDDSSHFSKEVATPVGYAIVDSYHYISNFDDKLERYYVSGYRGDVVLEEICTTYITDQERIKNVLLSKTNENKYYRLVDGEKKQLMFPLQEDTTK